MDSDEELWYGMSANQMEHGEASGGAAEGRDLGGVALTQSPTGGQSDATPKPGIQYPEGIKDIDTVDKEFKEKTRSLCAHGNNPPGTILHQASHA